MAGKFFPAVGIHLGPKGAFSTYNNAALPVGYEGQLGSIIEDGFKAWRLVKHDAVVASIDGGVAYWATKNTAATPYVVTADASTGECLAHGIAGGTHVVVAITVPAYIFIQVGGDQAAVVVAASAVAGDPLCGHASTDNVLTRTAAGTASVDKLAAVAMSTRGTTTSDNGASVANSSKVRWELGNLL